MSERHKASPCDALSAAKPESCQTSRNNITLHIRNIFKEGELEEFSVCKESLLTASEAKMSGFTRLGEMSAEEVANIDKKIDLIEDKFNEINMDHDIHDSDDHDMIQQELDDLLEDLEDLDIDSI